jgi:hypothetical protein
VDNSLIPRTFSPTDAKREREANAREAERRSSARNASNSTIGAGGTLDLQGDITVTGGGAIRVYDQGDIVITSEVQNPDGAPYQIAARLGNGVDGSSGIPSLDFNNTVLNNASFATIRSVQGTDLSSWAETPLATATCTLNAEPGYTAASLIANGNTGGPQPGYGELYIRPAGFSIRANTDGGVPLAKIEATQGSPMVISHVSGVDIQGTLTNNGAPISVGGGDWSTLTGKPSTFPPTIGTTSTTAKAGDYAPTIAGVTGLQAALDSKAPAVAPALKHWEKSGTITGVASGTLSGPGAGTTADATKSTDTGLISMTGLNTMVVRDAGTYAMSFGIKLQTGLNSQNGGGCSFEPSTGAAYAKGPIMQGDNQGTASIPNLKLAAGATVRCYIFHFAGSTVNVDWSMRITRIE